MDGNPPFRGEGSEAVQWLPPAGGAHPWELELLTSCVRWVHLFLCLLGSLACAEPNMTSSQAFWEGKMFIGETRWCMVSLGGCVNLQGGGNMKARQLLFLEFV